MTFRIDPITRFKPLHVELPYKEDDGYTIRLTNGDLGKAFTVTYRYNALIDPDVGSNYNQFDCEVSAKLFAGSWLEVLACTKDKDQREIADPEVLKEELKIVGSWSLSNGLESARVRQKFNALELGIRDSKLFLLVFGIRLLACSHTSRVKLRRIEYTVG